MKAATQQQENKKKQQAARLAAKAEHLDALKADLADNDRSMRSAAEHLLKALEFGATQRSAAEMVGRSQAWINRIKKWAEAGYAAEGPFAAESKAARERGGNFDQSTDQKDDRLGLGGNYPPAGAAPARATGSADTEIDTEARKAANAAQAVDDAPADDGSIPLSMRRAPPSAATLNESGALVAEALSRPDDDYRLELKDKLHHVFDDMEMLLKDKSAWAHLTRANQKKLSGAVKKLRKLREELLSISRNCFPASPQVSRS
jgi:hypothetical protein